MLRFKNHLLIVCFFYCSTPLFAELSDKKKLELANSFEIIDNKKSFLTIRTPKNLRIEDYSSLHIRGAKNNKILFVIPLKGMPREDEDFIEWTINCETMNYDLKFCFYTLIEDIEQLIEIEFTSDEGKISRGQKYLNGKALSKKNKSKGSP